MILRRYLSKEILKTSSAVTVILLLVFLSNQLVRYLDRAAAGKLAGSALFKILLYQIPELLGLLLPLGLFLGIMLAFGRLHAESELTVCRASGVGPWRQFCAISPVVILALVLVIVINFWVAPISISKRRALLANLGYSSLLASILPGQFQEADDGRAIVYVKSITRDRRHMRELFVARASGNPVTWRVLSAAKATQHHDELSGINYIVASNGNRYVGNPGQRDYQLTHFGTYAEALGKVSATMASVGVKGLPTATLLGLLTSSPATLANQMKHLHYTRMSDFVLHLKAELAWRYSVPVSLLLLAMFAVVLSKVSARAGRYSKLFIAILIYTLYANMLFVGRSWLKNGVEPAWLGLWWIHVVFAVGVSIAWAHETRLLSQLGRAR